MTTHRFARQREEELPRLELPPSIVTITRDEVIIEEKHLPAPTETARRYQLNVLLLGAGIVLASFWFIQHVETFFSQWLIVGFPALMAFWRLIYARSQNKLKQKVDVIRDKWLAQEGTTEQLLSICFAALVFLALTSSVWVKLGSGPVKAASIEVRDAGGKPFMPRIELDASTRIAGRLFFPRITREKLTFVVVEPKRYVLKERPGRALWPWTPLTLDFANDFEKKPVRVLRIIPAMSLRNDIGENGSDYTLTVRGTYGPAKRIERFPFKTVYVGIADPAELRAFHDENNNAAFATELEQELIADSVSPPNARRFAAMWQKRSLLGQMHDFRPGEKVTVTLEGRGTRITRTVELKEEITRLTLEPS